MNETRLERALNLWGLVGKNSKTWCLPGASAVGLVASCLEGCS